MRVTPRINELVWIGFAWKCLLRGKENVWLKKKIATLCKKFISFAVPVSCSDYIKSAASEVCFFLHKAFKKQESFPFGSEAAVCLDNLSCITSCCLAVNCKSLWSLFCRCLLIKSFTVNLHQKQQSKAMMFWSCGCFRSNSCSFSPSFQTW